MSRARDTIVIEKPFLMAYLDGDTSMLSSYATLTDINNAITALGYTEYIAIKPTLVGSAGSYVDVTDMSIEVVLRLSSTERAKLHDDISGEINGGLTETTDGSYWYVKKVISYDLVDGTSNFKSYMYHPSGFTQDNTLVELFNAITEETNSHQGDQTAFTLLYEYIMFSIAFYIISSKVYNDYLYTYIMQTNFEYDQAWDGMRNEFDDDPNRVIIEASEIAASEEAEWSRYVLSYQISKSLCMPAYIIARFITYARRELLAVKDTTGATSGSGIIFFDIANASGRSVLDEDPNTTITSLTNNINNVASGLSNALGRIATVVSSDLSTIALSINTMLFWFDYLAQQFGLTFPVYDPGNDQSGAPGDNIFVTIESLRAQLETIYTTLRLNRS